MIETVEQSIGGLVARGLQFHQRGDLVHAEEVYCAILMREPQHADALHLLGSVRGRQGLTAEGIRLMEEAIEASPRVSIYHNNLGNLKVTAGDLAGAEESYRRAIRIDRRNADAHLNLGKLLNGQSRLHEAKESFTAALRLAPRSFEAHMLLGVLEESEGRLRAALQSYNNVIRIDPRYELAHLAIGNVQVKLAAFEKAEESFRKALAINPHYAEALFNLAHTLHTQGRSSEAVDIYRRAIALSPRNDAEVYNNYGSALSGLKLHTEAEAAFRKAIERRPDFDDAYFNLGRELTNSGDPVAGMEMLRRAIEINSSNASAYLQLGNALFAQGFMQEAINANRKSLELNPSCRITRRNLGMVLASTGATEGLDLLEAVVRDNPASADLHWIWANKLLLHGRYEEGWREYEWRMQVEDMRASHREFAVPRWAGEPLAGKRILLYAEQGLGDALQFARYARLVAERGGVVILEVQPGLKRWCAALPGVAECVAVGEPLPQFEVFAPLMSLPYILGTREETIPPPAAPWFDDKRTGTAEDGAPLKVGVVWGGNGRHLFDQLRSTRLSEWSALARVEGVEFTSLQVGDPAAQIDEDGHGFAFATDCRGVRDFADTAAVVAGLDLVITVDTSVAHLAGSMGKPVWILLYNVVDWRWRLAANRTAWYPTARLFRQTTPGDWSGVFSELETCLRQLVAGQ